MFSVSIQNAGMKMFGKNDNKADAPKYRIAQEGVQYIFPFMSKQKVVFGSKYLCSKTKMEDNLWDKVLEFLILFLKHCEMQKST